MRLTKNFCLGEFACKGRGCCGHSSPISSLLVCYLQELRDKLGVPVTVNSGFRCRVHNQKVGGSPSSLHTVGLAADISCSLPPEEVVEAAQGLGIEWGAIIIYPTFTHLDLRHHFWMAKQPVRRVEEIRR